MKAGVLALRGALREHREVLDALGVEAVEVRVPEHLGGLDALFMPGSESTTIGKLLDPSGLREPLHAALTDGLPACGTCAELILHPDDVREVAARGGGSDLEGNPTLRAAVQKARDSSVPADTIDRAIKRGTGELEGVRYEPASYEGYASGGVAVYIECLSDNRNRTGQEVKNIFTRNGGSLAEPGAVAWQFERKGVIYVERRAATEDDLMLAALDAGAEDIVDEGDTWRITTSPTDLQSVRSALEGAGIPFTSAELTMLPNQTVPLTDEATARGVLRLIDALEEHDDVQAVYANFDIPDDVLQAVVA